MFLFLINYINAFVKTFVAYSKNVDDGYGFDIIKVEGLIRGVCVIQITNPATDEYDSTIAIGGEFFHIPCVLSDFHHTGVY